jgi:hypothetical protein
MYGCLRHAEMKGGRSYGREAVAERKKEAGHVVVMLRRRRNPAGDPVENVGVGAVEQGLVVVELTVVKHGQMRIGKAAEDQVALPRPAVPGTEQQPLAANL